MPNTPKVVPIAKPTLPTKPRALARHGVHRNQIIVSIGPVVYAVEYAVRITALDSVPSNGPGRVISMRNGVKPPSDKPNPSA